MAGSPVSPVDYVRAGVDARVDEIFVARPGKVTAYDPLTNTAVVQPTVKHALYKSDDERVFEDLPEIPFVPVLWPRAGNFAITMPLTPGDTVLLVFCDVSLAEWRDTGQVSEPVDARRHSLGWPIAVPGLYPDNSPLSAAALDVAARVAGAVLGEHGGPNRVEFSATGIKIGKDAIDFVALATPTMAGINAAMAAANAGISAAAAMVSTFNSHTHTCAGAGSPSSPPVSSAAAAPVAAAPPGAVAATRVKAK